MTAAQTFGGNVDGPRVQTSKCGNDPVAFMHEKNCSRLEVPESDPSLEARVLRLEKWAADTARWSDAIVERIEAQ